MKLLLVDLDGTLREPLSGADFTRHPRDFKVIPNADKALAHYHRESWLIVGITNQGGVAVGFKSLGNCIEEQRYTFQLFPQLSSILFCPDFEGKICYQCIPEHIDCYNLGQKYPQLIGKFRKPNPGMLEACLLAHNVNPCESWMVGDRLEDEKAAEAAGINFMAADIWRERFREEKYDASS